MRACMYLMAPQTQTAWLPSIYQRQPTAPGLTSCASPGVSSPAAANRPETAVGAGVSYPVLFSALLLPQTAQHPVYTLSPKLLY